MKHLNEAYNANIQALAAPLREHIARLERPIHLAGDVGRAKIRIGAAGMLLRGQTHEKLTGRIAADVLEKIVDRYAAGEVNDSEKRIVHTLFENRDAVHPILQAVRQSPSIDRFWRHEKRLHGGIFPEVLGPVATAKLHALVAEHFATIPAVEDLVGKPQRSR